MSPASCLWKRIGDNNDTLSLKHAHLSRTGAGETPKVAALSVQDRYFGVIACLRLEGRPGGCLQERAFGYLASSGDDKHMGARNPFGMQP